MQSEMLEDFCLERKADIAGVQATRHVISITTGQISFRNSIYLRNYFRIAFSKSEIKKEWVPCKHRDDAVRKGFKHTAWR